MIYYDQHTHSSFSEDSEEDLKNYYIEATKNNIEYICTCEHFDYLTVISGKTWDCDFPKAIKYREELKKEFPNIKPLLGVELGYKPRGLNAIKELSNKYPFDIIQLSVHDNDRVDFYFKEAFDLGIDYTLNEYFDFSLEAITNFTNYDVYSHIDYAFKTAKMIDNSLELSKYENKIKNILELIIKQNKTLEINTKVESVINSINNDYSNTIYLLNLYKSLGGIKVTLSSDAHQVSKYRNDFDIYMKIIKDCGFDKLSYFIKRKEYFYEIN